MKAEPGLDHSEGRSWGGLHHHALLYPERKAELLAAWEAYLKKVGLVMLAGPGFKQPGTDSAHGSVAGWPLHGPAFGKE